MNTQADLLTKILRYKEIEVAKVKQALSLKKLKNLLKDLPACRDFYQALDTHIQNKKPAVIGEIKKSSPSQGVIREVFLPHLLAKEYERGGACCLSVLTDYEFFDGNPTYLIEAKRACSLPVLRKDFMIDPYQIYESRLMGADCVLLIIAALEDNMLAELAKLAKDLGMAVLFEVHNQNELERALAQCAQFEVAIIGINNRNLKTFAVDLNTTPALCAEIYKQQKFMPNKIIVVSESGIKTKEDIKMMCAHGVYGFLIGESLMRAENTTHALRLLIEIGD